MDPIFREVLTHIGVGSLAGAVAGGLFGGEPGGGILVGGCVGLFTGVATAVTRRSGKHRPGKKKRRRPVR